MERMCYAIKVRAYEDCNEVTRYYITQATGYEEAVKQVIDECYHEKDLMEISIAMGGYAPLEVTETIYNRVKNEEDLI